MKATVNGYALQQPPGGGWSYRAVTDDMDLVEGETFYESMDDFPQDAKDWFASHVVY